jgi:hypothetical protein
MRDAAERIVLRLLFVRSIQTQAIPKAKIRDVIQGVAAMGRPFWGISRDFNNTPSMSDGRPMANKTSDRATVIAPMTTLTLRFLIFFFGAV